jgi:hypothetical protein
LTAALKHQHRSVSSRSVARLLNAAGYSLRSNRKTREGSSHRDRNAQFEFINAAVKRFQKQNQPLISVDTKKKELVGHFRNGGRERWPKSKLLEVLVHDFPDPKLGKAIPYGVYDLTHKEDFRSAHLALIISEFPSPRPEDDS